MRNKDSLAAIIFIVAFLFLSVHIGDAQTAAIDQELLNYIDTAAGNYYNTNWAITLEQYKAWIANNCLVRGKFRRIQCP